jgi:hypothetical protein
MSKHRTHSIRSALHQRLCLLIYPTLKVLARRVAQPLAFFLLANTHDCMIPLQYVNPEELLLPFRVADPFGF